MAASSRIEEELLADDVPATLEGRPVQVDGVRPPTVRPFPDVQSP